ncbi:MAG: class B sortase [Lachnospiraceae bacterium]|nr:class B sortase [Lachnospiraceae bacterium]MDE6920764.1 class B sortase [Lachnospiraceae bacterium]MDE7001541.1 class B sortase [Lachnospiraceae bacterium]
MAEIKWTVEGRRFRNAEEYQSALRDKKLIDTITGSLDLDDPKDIERLYVELKNGKYTFESIVGRQFDDNIYELYQRIKREEREREEEKAARKERRKQRTQRVKNASRSSGQQDKAQGRARLEDFDKDMQRQIVAVLKKKEQKRKMLIAGCLFMCIVSFGYLGAYYQVSAKSAREFEELAALKEAGAQYRGSTEVKIHLTDDTVETPDILPEYTLVHQKNQRLIGWVKIDDTIVDYPVMQTVNNEYYLDHNFNQEEDRNGCIFMDYQCDVIRGCDNIILYGHHMKSGKMFGTLNKYSKESYYEEHPVIQFDTIYEKGTYQVMYVFRSKVYSEEDVTFKYYQFINAASEKEFNSAMNEMAALSLYDTGVTASYGDQLLTLSTCDYQENKGRFVVVAKKIS